MQPKESVDLQREVLHANVYLSPSTSVQISQESRANITPVSRLGTGKLGAKCGQNAAQGRFGPH